MGDPMDGQHSNWHDPKGNQLEPILDGRALPNIFLGKSSSRCATDPKIANQIANEPRGAVRYWASHASTVGLEMANWSTRLATG